MGLLLVSTQPIYAEDSLGFEKWLTFRRTESLACRISCVGEPEDHVKKENAIKGVDRSVLTQFVSVGASAWENPAAE